MNKYFKYGLSSVVSVFFLGVATAVLANGLFAPRISTDQPYFNGPYVGIGGGMVHAHADVHDSAYAFSNIGSTLFEMTKDYDFDMGKYGFNGNIFAGYGRTLDTTYYLGGELFGNYFSPTLKGCDRLHHELWIDPRITDVNMSTEVKNRYSFGGDLRAGYLVLPRTMVYVLFGLDYARFDMKSEFSYQYATTIPLFSQHVANEFEKWKLGYVPGVGIEAGLTNHVSLRVQYTHTFYSSFNYKEEFLTFSGLFGAPYHKQILTTKVKPSRGLFTVKLSYLFN